MGLLWSKKQLKSFDLQVIIFIERSKIHWIFLIAKFVLLTNWDTGCYSMRTCTLNKYIVCVFFPIDQMMWFCQINYVHCIHYVLFDCCFNNLHRIISKLVLRNFLTVNIKYTCMYTCLYSYFYNFARRLHVFSLLLMLCCSGFYYSILKFHWPVWQTPSILKGQ